ncbi:DUF397 domain-containing protein [Streptomyces sp. NPDC094437]|uniref:DUF397 domain-containing protein n=1 Tax=Streptomyces sp. NPDC094437 TaxID=3366060 RepID=UPI003828A04C
MTKIPNASATGFAWKKSSFSGGQSNCVEAALTAVPGALPVRDSKALTGPAVVFGDTTWGEFVNAVKRGDLV